MGPRSQAAAHSDAPSLASALMTVPMSTVSDDLPDAGTERFLVDDLLVDVGQQRVVRDGIDIALPNLSFRLLLALIRAAPNVLSNDELMERVWPGLIVSPETVNKRVKLLRDALGDDAQEPRYVVAIRSRGYRLVATVIAATSIAAAVELLASQSSTPVTVPRADRTSSVGPGRRLWSVLALAANYYIDYCCNCASIGASPADLERKRRRRPNRCASRCQAKRARIPWR